VELTGALRETVRKVTAEMHDYFRRGVTPKVKTSPKCRSCSLREVCLPKLCRTISAKDYLENMLKGGDDR
jgi:CRISPR-associated exonuclease Cas4